MEKNNPEKNYFNEMIYKPVIKEITNHVVENLLNEFEDQQNATANSSDFINFLKNRNKKIDEPEEMIAFKKSDRNENCVFKSKLPAINKYLKDMVDYSNFIICESIVKIDSKTMSSRRRNLEQMIVDHNMRLQRKYGFDISTYRDIDIDKVIKYIIDYPPIESGSITRNNKGIVHLKFDKALDDKDDIGHLFDFRTFVKPHLILLLINYMTIKFKTSSNLTLSNIYISARQSYVYGNLVDRFFVVFEFDKIDNDGEIYNDRGSCENTKKDKDFTKTKSKPKTTGTKKSKSPHYDLKPRGN